VPVRTVRPRVRTVVRTQVVVVPVYQGCGGCGSVYYAPVYAAAPVYYGGWPYAWTARYAGYGYGYGFGPRFRYGFYGF
jgi:hypothetical protein